MSSHSEGHVAAGFEPVRALFDRLMSQEEGFSAQLCIYSGDERVVDLAGGPVLGLDSLTGVYSVSKGVAAMVIAMLLDDGRLDLDARVVDCWPEFEQAGKQHVNVRQLLSHQAGLPVLEGGFTISELTDSRIAAGRLASQSPLWRLGSGFGYHTLTLGALMEELVRRVTGASLQEIFESAIRAPRDADFYLGLPEPLDHRYVPVIPPVPVADQPDENALLTESVNNIEAPNGVSGLLSVSSNELLVRRSGPAAFGGVGSARGLARLYADVRPRAKHPIASTSVFRAMAQGHSWGRDRVLNSPGSFGVIYMLPHVGRPFGSSGAFGHDGAGGAWGFVDGSSDMSFGYVPSPMQSPDDDAPMRLARLARRILASR